MECGGTRYDTAEAETRQLDYYKNKGVTTSYPNSSGAIKQYNGSNSHCWLRSARFDYASSFFAVHDYGGWYTTNTNDTYGVSTAFRIA